MISFFIILYMSIKKYNKKLSNNADSDDTIDNDLMKYVTNKHLRTPKKINDTPYYIDFNYEIIKDEQLVNQYQKEQKEGVNTTIKYPNRFIVKLDENDKPIWSDYKTLTGNPNSFIDNRILFGDNLYSNHIRNMDGKLNPNDANITDNGKTLKNIYDSHILDFKDLVPQNELIDNNNIKLAASNLSYLDNDEWQYKNESIMNGGPIINNFYAADPTIYNTPAIYE